MGFIIPTTTRFVRILSFDLYIIKRRRHFLWCFRRFVFVSKTWEDDRDGISFPSGWLLNDCHGMDFNLRYLKAGSITLFVGFDRQVFGLKRDSFGVNITTQGDHRISERRYIIFGRELHISMRATCVQYLDCKLAANRKAYSTRRMQNPMKSSKKVTRSNHRYARR